MYFHHLYVQKEHATVTRIYQLINFLVISRNM